MEKEFLPYELALDLSDLGFDYRCFGTYRQWDGRTPYLHLDTDLDTDNFTVECDAPLFQQVFDWFREEHYLPSCLEPYIQTKSDWEDELTYLPKIYTIGGYITLEVEVYEDARLSCLRKLIEFVKDAKSTR